MNEKKQKEEEHPQEKCRLCGEWWDDYLIRGTWCPECRMEKI